MNKRALILIDLQNDFFPGGALSVPGAEALFPLANEIQAYFPMVIATQDWHPPTHKSFASNHPRHTVDDVIMLDGLEQILWPDHCVQETKGSELHPKLNTKRIQKIIHKGTNPNIDSYSAFFDNAHRKKTELDDFLKAQHIQDIYIMGLATDYCALYTVLDAIQLGYHTHVITDGCYGINKNPGDIERALKKMEDFGATLLTSQDIQKSFTTIV